MTSDTIDYFMGLPDGANYVVLYQMLCLKTINTEGRFERQIGAMLIPYDVEKIRRDTKWFSADTIRVALNLYKQFGLIYEDVNGVLVIANHKGLVGSETDSAQRMQNMRNRRRAEQIPSHCDGGCDENVTPENRDKSLEIREQSTEIRGQISEKNSFNDDSNDDDSTEAVIDEFAKRTGLVIEGYELFQKCDSRTRKKVAKTTRTLFEKAVGTKPTEMDEAKVFSWTTDLTYPDSEGFRISDDRIFILTCAFYKAADAGHRGQWNYIDAIMGDMNLKGIDTKDKAVEYFHTRKGDTVWQN